MPPDDIAMEGFDDAELRDTLRADLGVGADAGLPDEVRFRLNVVRLIAKRIVSRAEDAPPAVFFLRPVAPEVSDAAKVRRERMLDNGVAEVEGAIWFVGPTAANAVGITIAATIDEWSDDAVFSLATDQLGVGVVPAILFETRTPNPEARFYPNGLADPDRYEALRLGSGELTIEDIFEEINRVYEEALVTPDAMGVASDFWVDPDKHWVAKQAERRIQSYLRLGLSQALPACRVWAEQPQATGRIDLEIDESDPHDRSVITRHAVLELKVLRSYGSTGTSVSENDTREHVSDGVLQAAAYRDDRKTREAALCCFDMRKTISPRCFDHVREKAEERDVKLRAWRLYATSKAYREALDAEAAA